MRVKEDMRKELPAVVTILSQPGIRKKKDKKGNKTRKISFSQKKN